jgi:serine/threonine protein kinase
VSETALIVDFASKLTETEVNAPSEKDVGQTPLLSFGGSSALIVERPAAVGSRPDVGVVNRKMERMPRSREVIDERFTIEQLAGFGGMGQIYRARDRRSGGLVALKVMHDAERLELERFAREAQVLATLSHPGIVRYIDSGITAEGEPYLVMEWLSGETLSSRLQRTQLTLSEALALGRRVASALSAIHRGGIVHRDIKPSNLFLRDGAIDKVTLIDFGMARRPLADPRLTVTGTMLGTPGYIAPEQVDHFSTLDGRADIFSLGCVLYRCISGRAPFRGPDALRMLLNGLPRMLPRLREFRPSIPRELDDLVARMLSRSPEDRPASGDAVATELLAIEESEPSPRSATQSAPRSVLSEIMAAERRLMSLVVVRLPERTDSSLTIAERAAQERTLHELIERHRGKLEVLTDGLLLVILSNADAAIDLASRAARCALVLQQALGPGAAAVVTGREIPGPSLRDSELLHHAVEVLDGARGTTTVRLDELTCALLHPRFDTGATGRELHGERLDPIVTGTLPGALCAGREQELDQLEMIFDQCTEEHAATMVLLSGPDGVGKSRLGHEFLRRLAAREQPPRIWTGVADPLSSGSVFGLLVQVLRRALDLGDDEPLEARRDKLRAWAACHPGAGGLAFVETLGELIGTPFETDDRDEPGTVRDNPKLPSEQMRQSFVGVLGEECAAQPVVIVLEDLHWGDLSTIKLMYAALGALSDRPLMVLALARNNVTELFPQLWADRCVQEIRLRRLSRRASAQLVRQGLGDAVAEDAVRALVERSDRHASYLQELIRAAAAGNFDLTPPAVLAMVQARLEKLDPSARRVLRAASIFGTTFWRGSVEELIGGGDTAAWLAVLVDQGVVELKNEARFADEVEYRFQHTLIREAAYETLTSDDRIAGHWLAAQWLERLGEDPAVVLEHFERCGRGGGPGASP